MKQDNNAARGCCGCLSFLVVIVVAIYAAAWFLDSDPLSLTSAPTPVAVATAAPVPTATPTPALEPCPTADEAAYLRLLRVGIPAIGQGFIDLGDLSARADADPSLLRDVAFRLAYEGEIDTIKTVAQRILDFTLPPPVRNVPLYGLGKAMARSTIFGMDHLLNALEHSDAGRGRRAVAELEQATFNIDNAAFSMETAAAGVDAFCE